MNIQAFLSDDTRGETPLWVVFWFYGVIASHLYFAAVLLLFRQLDTALVGLMLAGFIAYTAWIVRAIWVNAFNVENRAYSHIARALTVAWAINAILVSVFLFLAHLDWVPAPL
jgi:hypothetical protein